MSDQGFGAALQVADGRPRLPGSLHMNRRLSQWLAIRPEGRVTVTPGKVELGQGILTALAQIAAEELDVAIAIDRFENVVAWRVAAVERKWAGLRSFAPDRLPVYGYDPLAPGFFWCAGQGGFGIQPAPAAAALCAALILRRAVPDGLDPDRYRPERFAS